MKRLFIFTIILSSCIGTDVVEDFVAAEIVISTRITKIEVGTTETYEATYFNNVGEPEEADIIWSSSDDSIIAIDSRGDATALTEGFATIGARVGEITASIDVEVGAETVIDPSERMANIATTSSYPLTGTAVLKSENGQLVLDLLDDFNTTSRLPGLYVYLTNNANNISDAIEIGKVEKFSGEQTYIIPGNPDLFDFGIVLFYCKPFAVPVGNGEFN